MKTLLALALAAFSGFGFAADEKKDDPIVGKWRGFGIQGRIWELLPDKKVIETRLGKKPELVGSWEKVDSKSVELKYKVTLSDGAFIYTLSMNRAFDKLTGESSSGKKVQGDLIKE